MEKLFGCGVVLGGLGFFCLYLVSCPIIIVCPPASVSLKCKKAGEHQFDFS